MLDKIDLFPSFLSCPPMQAIFTALERVTKDDHSSTNAESWEATTYIGSPCYGGAVEVLGHALELRGANTSVACHPDLQVGWQNMRTQVKKGTCKKSFGFYMVVPTLHTPTYFHNSPSSINVFNLLSKLCNDSPLTGWENNKEHSDTTIVSCPS